MAERFAEKILAQFRLVQPDPDRADRPRHGTGRSYTYFGGHGDYHPRERTFDCSERLASIIGELCRTYGWHGFSPHEGVKRELVIELLRGLRRGRDTVGGADRADLDRFIGFVEGAGRRGFVLMGRRA